MLHNGNQSFRQLYYDLIEVQLTVTRVKMVKLCLFNHKLIKDFELSALHTNFNRHTSFIEKGRTSQLLHLLYR